MYVNLEVESYESPSRSICLQFHIYYFSTESFPLRDIYRDVKLFSSVLYLRGVIHK